MGQVATITAEANQIATERCGHMQSRSSHEAKVLDVFTKDPVQVLPMGGFMWTRSVPQDLCPPGGEGREGAKDERAATPPAL